MAYIKTVTKRNPETGVVENVRVPMTQAETTARQTEENYVRPISSIQVKAEAERRIVAVMDKNTQRNLLALGQETIMTYGADTANWPVEEQTILSRSLTKWAQIKHIRVKSNELENMNPIPQNFTDDSWWD